MKAKRFGISLLMATLVAVLMFTTVFAGGITPPGVWYPQFPISGDGLKNCEPWTYNKANFIRLSAIPEGSDVVVNFGYSAPRAGGLVFQPAMEYQDVTGTAFSVSVPYPKPATTWPGYNPDTGEYTIAMAAFIKITAPDGTITKLNTKQWWVRCVPVVVEK